MSRAAIRLGALLGAFGLSACGGAVTNAEWVSAPEPGNAVGGSATLERDDAPSYTVSDSAPQSGPRRLDHTVTLGAVVATTGDPAPAPAAGPAAVTINVNNYVTPGPAAYGYGYAAVPIGGRFGTGASRPAFAGAHHGGGSSMQPGQSWPAAPSYGPAFPYSLSPASPWETKR